MVDFKVVYYPARCLIQHSDPYKESNVLSVYQKEGTHHELDNPKILQIVTRYMYLPTAFCFTTLFAMLPWGPAHLIWLMLTAGSVLLASFLAWELGADFAPILSGSLIGFLLANSVNLIALSNAAGIAVSLCVIASWCFLRGRFVACGVLSLALSLALKPQDAGFIWLYFLLAGRDYRKYAMRVLLVTAILSVPVLIWISYVAPHWVQEWNYNVGASTVPGGLNDPGPASAGAHGLGMLVSLQPVFAFFWDNPQFYNSLTCLLLAPLLITWGVATIRTRVTPARAWLGIAAIATLSMLPVYHRQQDTKLLLLTVPACAMLWRQGGIVGNLSVLANAAGLVLTGDLPWLFLLTFVSRLHLPTAGIGRFVASIVLTGMQVFAVPLALLVLGIFYLWLYIRCPGYSSNFDPKRDWDPG